MTHTEEIINKFPEVVMKHNFVVVYNPSHVKHNSNGGSPENPERLTDVMRLLNGRANVFKKFDCDLQEDIKDYGEDVLRMVHDEKYIAFIKDYVRKGGGFLGDSTYFTYGTFDAALKAAYGTIQTAENVISGKYMSGLALVRPPGHHAKTDRYGGYCIFNNVAITARYIQKNYDKKKIMIIDYDAHAGNGTSEIFYEDDSVMFVSLHQSPKGFYPNECFKNEIGKGKGRGYNVNIEMEKGSTDEDYQKAFDQIIFPIYKQYDPDFVLICLGFDTHHSDKYTDIKLTSETYYRMGKRMSHEFAGKGIIVSEGGYNNNVGMLIYSLISGFFDKANPFVENIDYLSASVISQEKTHKVNVETIKEIKSSLNPYFQ